MTREIPLEVRQRAAAKAAYVKSLIGFTGALCLLAIINLLTSPGYLWFLWVALFGGAAYVVKGVKVFGNLNAIEADLHKHFEKKEMEKLKKG